MSRCVVVMVFVSPGRSGAVDGDVAEGGAPAYLDGLVGFVGPGGVLQQVAYVSESGVDLEPGAGALGDADVQGAVGGADHDRAADHLAESDVAVGRLRVNTGAGSPDVDVAVGRAHPHIASDRVDRGV